MFPSRTCQRFGRAVLELAEAMLAPMPPNAHDDAAPAEPIAHSAPAHPHHAARRIQREHRRRPGTVAPPAHHCVTPLAPRAGRAGTGAERSADLRG